ncbi:RAB5C [Mytilus edulis]|uniref:RAB5C n=1 Tax=Mytilus edulis TaxID=6550 RepID=A0A8S3SUR7_MYTED|nr:RAB5C [Mytilus edulis]
MNGNLLPVIKVKVVVVGDAGVGKTSLAVRFTDNSFIQHYKQTVGGNEFCSRALDFKDKTVVFNIWDTAGQERFRSLVPMYLRDAGIALAVYDISSHNKQYCTILFRNPLRILSWLLQLQQYGPRDLKCALIGNKIDLDDDLREVPTQEGQLLAEGHGLYFEETSAKSGDRIDKVFNDIGIALVERCKKEKRSSTVSICDSYVHRKKKTCC